MDNTTGDAWYPLCHLGVEMAGTHRVNPEDFMFMGTTHGRIHLYKHVDTRRYLNVDSLAHCYAYVNGDYVPIGPRDAIAHAYS